LLCHSLVLCLHFYFLSPFPIFLNPSNNLWNSVYAGRYLVSGDHCNWDGKGGASTCWSSSHEGAFHHTPRKSSTARWAFFSTHERICFIMFEEGSGWGKYLCFPYTRYCFLFLLRIFVVLIYWLMKRFCFMH
jgi:hypothetical protein